MDLTHNFSPLLSFEYKYYPIDCIVIILRVQSEFIDMDLWHESLDLIDWLIDWLIDFKRAVFQCIQDENKFNI